MRGRRNTANLLLVILSVNWARAVPQNQQDQQAVDPWLQVLNGGGDVNGSVDEATGEKEIVRQHLNQLQQEQFPAHHQLNSNPEQFPSHHNLRPNHEQFQEPLPPHHQNLEPLPNHHQNLEPLSPHHQNLEPLPPHHQNLEPVPPHHQQLNPNLEKLPPRHPLRPRHKPSPKRPPPRQSQRPRRPPNFQRPRPGPPRNRHPGKPKPNTSLLGSITDTIGGGINAFTCGTSNLIADAKLKDQDFMRFQFNCARDKGPCDDIGETIKILAPEVLAGRCPKPCNDCTKQQLNKVMAQLSQTYPEEFREMVLKFNKRGRPIRG